MKKVSFLLSVMYLLPLSCMEMEYYTHITPQRCKQQYRNTEVEIPLMPLHTSRSDIVPPKRIEANEPGWEKLDEIANMTYKNKQQKPTQAIVDLQPVYRPINHENNDDEEAKKIAVTKDQIVAAVKKYTDPFFTKLEVYDKALHYLAEEKSSLEQLVTLLTLMNDAKTNKVDEDTMAEFAYDQYVKPEDFGPLHRERWADKKAERFLSILLFGYLKYYNTARMKAQVQENIPTINDLYIEKTVTTDPYDHENHLAYLLGLIPLSSSTQKIRNNRKYFWFFNLQAWLEDVRNRSYRSLYGDKKVTAFLSYIYSTKKTAHKKASHSDFTQMSYDQLKSTFYDKVYAVFSTYNRHEDKAKYDQSIYELVKIIEAGQLLAPKKLEHDFGYDIAYEETASNKVRTFLNYDPIITLDRQAYALLCNFIKKYNKNRATTITPTIEQLNAYETMRHRLRNFTLPAACDQNIFDAKIYALHEFDRLISNINHLKICLSFNKQHIQECFNKLYPPRK